MNGIGKIHCSVDPIVFALEDEKLYILLIKRGQEPFKSMHALPGGLIDERVDKDLEHAAKRVLHDKTNLDIRYMEQLSSQGSMSRDPRGWTMSVAYIALVHKQEVENSFWCDVSCLPKNMAFDHAHLIEKAMDRLLSKTNYSTLPIYFLDDEFTLPDLQKVYESLLGKKQDKSQFRKRIEATGMLVNTGKKIKNGAYRPAVLYKAKNNEIYNFDNNISKGD